ncbi:PEP-utilizing enzyme [Brachybacterium sp. NBEC-018]|uniref:PEP/pyruvate-binding domain-containing protein n=1 Tax=Brachybacterium sp. NBEC-018 TaxID=2996004 RepID=UPI0021755443|nr:PEP/pyruvate-binding domain-containing protein [Brachybacterium sp. NBEC-018]UVY84622.1 PEP-utilizing enzyme [Brachybacterium sp. NBEC-018]
MDVRSLAGLTRDDIAEVGGKAAHLGELLTLGAPVPPGSVLTTGAYRRALTPIEPALLDLAARVDPEDMDGAEELSRRITDLVQGVDIPADLRSAILAARDELGETALAVRSSATAEDLEDASFAGQQETFLGVRGEEELLRAVRGCWASLWSARALVYRARRGIDPAEVSLAVVLQAMVEAEAAGVLFTANPATGRRQETVVSAAWGLGEAVVSGLVDTDQVVVDTAAQRVLSRTTADKQVMVVPAEGGTATVPVPAARRRLPVLSDEQALDLAAWGSRIERAAGTPQDVEWVLTPDGLVLTQARSIVALAPESGPVPTAWTVPRRRAGYFRASIVEQMPDPLTPLFADLTAAHVIPAMIATVAEAAGRDDVFRDRGVDFVTINGYAYYGYANTSMADVTARSVLLVPRLLRGGVGGPRFWEGTALPRYRALVAERTATPVTERGARLLLEDAETLTRAGFACYTAVQTVIPPVVIAETTFSALHRRLARPGDPRPEQLLLGFPSAPLRAEESLWDLAAQAREDPALTAALLDGDSLPAEQPGSVDAAAWERWQEGLAAHLAARGHATYTLDLAQPVAADTPDLLTDVLRMFLRGEGRDPRERRAEMARAREEGQARMLGRLRGPLRRLYASRLASAQRLTPVREDALASVGLGWPAARAALRELGARLVAAGAVADREDVFWLRREELAALAEALDAGRTALPSHAAAVERRRVVHRGQRLAEPPQLLPQRSLWRAMDRWMPSSGGSAEGETLRGIGGSGGTVTATVRVLSGPEEFGQFRPGEVLVAAITTPAWTPLFAMAAGVVTDVGGPLSHSSIVAREYGIPAVLGTGSATRRLRTGDRVVVDGDTGTVRPAEDA